MKIPWQIQLWFQVHIRDNIARNRARFKMFYSIRLPLFFITNILKLKTSDLDGIAEFAVFKGYTFVFNEKKSRAKHVADTYILRDKWNIRLLDGKRVKPKNYETNRQPRD